MTAFTDLVDEVNVAIEAFDAARGSFSFPMPGGFDFPADPSPDDVLEAALLVASRRERVAYMVSLLEASFAAVSGAYAAAEGHYEDAVAALTASEFRALKAAEYASEDRRAVIATKTIDLRISLRRLQRAVDLRKAQVAQGRFCHAEWKAAEFFLDRLVRLISLRSRMADV